jgi:hypothetical protein
VLEIEKVRLREMQAAAMVLLMWSGSLQPAWAQAQTAPAGAPRQTSPTQPTTAPATGADQNNLPQTPQPNFTEPLYLRDTGRDYTHLHSFLWNPLGPFTATD